MEAALYSTTGKKISTLSIPEAVFGVRWNPDLVHQVMEAERSNQRKNIAHVKMRGDVSGGGKKPWRQKGTGRARHGSIRSPIWIGGGVTHGPTTEKIFSKKINRVMAKKALAAVFSAKLRDQEIIFMDDLGIDSHKTKRVVEILSAISQNKEFSSIGEKRGTVIVLLPGTHVNAVRAVQNLPYVRAKEARMLQVLDLLSHKFIVIPKSAIEVLERSASSKNHN